MKKKFGNFLKQLDDSPKKKRDISANGRRMIQSSESDRSRMRNFGYATVGRCRERSERPPDWRDRRRPLGADERAQRAIAPNVRDIRSFSGTKWKKNLGEKILLSLIYYKVQNF